MTPESPMSLARPDAPYDLDDEESAEWRAQVAAMPADHFTRNTFPMLAQLCRHIVASRRLAQLTQALTNPTGGSTRGKKKEFDIGRYAMLLDQQRKETAAITRLSTRMRLTQQSMIHPEKLSRSMRNRPATIEAPWLKDDEDE